MNNEEKTKLSNDLTALGIKVQEYHALAANRSDNKLTPEELADFVILVKQKRELENKLISVLVKNKLKLNKKQLEKIEII